MKQKTNRLHFSTRTVAMILSIIMLIGSIATGSMLSTFAAYLQDAAQADAVTQAATEGSDIAKSAIPSEDNADDEDAKPDLSDFEENEIVRGMKDDFAAVGANADLAMTGDDTYYIWFAGNNAISSDSNYSSKGAMTAVGDGRYYKVFTDISYYGNFGVVICTSNSDITSGRDTSLSKTNTITDGNFNNPFDQEFWKGGTSLTSVCSSKKTSSSVLYVVYNPTSHSLEFTTTAPTSGGGGSGEGGGDEGDDSGQTTGTAVADNDLIAVLKRTKIYIYFGDCWNDDDKSIYLVSDESLVAQGSKLTNKLGTKSDVRVVAGCITPAVAYRITHTDSYPDWADSFTPTLAQGGYAFHNYNDNGNKVGTITGNASITWSEDSDSIKVGDSSCAIVAEATGSTAYASATTVKYYYTTDNSSFYEFNPNDTDGLEPGTYTIYAAATDGNVYVSASSQATLTVLPRLATPVIKLDTATGSNTSSQTASTTATSTVTVTNVNDYPAGTIFRLYKGNDLKQYNTSGTFTVARNSDTAGVYKVIAIPGASDTTHSNSADSNTPTLAITKVAAPDTPTLTIDKTKIDVDGKVTLTISNFSSANDNKGYDPAIYDLKIFKVYDNSSDTSTVTKDYKKAFSEATFVDTAIDNSTFAYNSKEWAHYKVQAVPKDDTVYTASSASDAVHVKAIKAQWYTYGAVPFGDNGWDASSPTYIAVNKYYRDEIFYQVYTASDDNQKNYRLSKGSGSDYADKDGTNKTGTNTVVDEASAVELKQFTYDDETYLPYLYVSGATTYFLFVDQTSPNKVWVRTDLAEITIDPQYVNYDVATDTFTNAADADDTYVTVNTGNVFVKDAGSAYTVTAHVENPDYEFIGWYDTAYSAGATPITTNTTLSVASASTNTYVPVVRQKVPAKHDVHVDKVNGVTVNATWNSRTASNGRYLSNVPAGATVTISGSSEAGYRFDNLIIKSADGDTITPTGTVKDTKTLSSVTFTMPDSAVTITAVTEEYWGTDSSYYLYYTKTGNDHAASNPGNASGNTWSQVNATVYSSGSEYYVKIPVACFTGTSYSYFGLTNTAAPGDMFWSGTGTGDSTSGDVTDDSKFILSADYGYNFDSTAKKYYRYSRANFIDASYLELAEYVLLHVDTANDGKKGQYHFSVVMKDTGATHTSFIAKDGPARRDIAGSSQANDQQTLGVIGSTKVTATGDATAIGSQTTHATFNDGKTIQYYTGALEKGTTYKIRTTVSDSRFYVKAFNVNGVTVAELNKPASTPEANTEYTCEYTVPDDAPSVLEITPIYFHYDDSNCVTFYLEGYDDVIQQELGWGDTPYIYPYYATQTKDPSGGASAAHNAFGAYCGQPMITSGGVYYTQIPLTDIDLVTPSGTGTETGTNIKGITISNGWYDTIHREKEGWANDDTLHLQTYDYDDFQKIFVEKNPTNIYFQMKLREDRDNAETYRTGDVTTLSASDIADIGSNGNGWELLKDRHNRTTDLFGVPLTTAQLENEALYVISTGYRNNIAGDYGTEWRVYKKVGNEYVLQTATGDRNYAIPPSLLFVNEVSNLYDAVYPMNTHSFYVGDLNVSAPNDNPATYEAIYNKLKTESSNAPVYITYEKNDRTTKSNYGVNDTTMYGPYRLDGRWYYTSAGDEINSNIEIQYLDGAGGYKTDTLTTGYKGEDNLGEHTGSKAYFTGEFDGKTESGKVILDSTKSFTMRAEAGDGYEFVGWYIKQDKAYVSMNPTNKTASTASSPRNASATYVARFKKLTKGNLTVANHNATGVAPDGNTYNGSGAGLVTVSYTTDGGTNWTSVGNAASADAVTVGTDILTDANLTLGPDFKLKVVLGNTPDGEDAFGLYHNKYSNRTSTTEDQEYIINLIDLFTVTNDGEGNIVYTQNTFSLLFDTYFTEHTYEYVIRYHYRASRLNNAFQTFSVINTFDANMKKSIVDGEDKLTVEFIESVRPTLSNFRQDMVYAENGISRLKGVVSQDGKSTKYDATVTYENENDNGVNITLLFPYQVINRASGTFDFTPVDEQGVVIKDQTEGTILVQLNSGYEKYLTQTGTATDTVSGLLTAPASIKNGESIEYFQYWKVTDPAGEEAIRVYNPMFNYRLFDNYRIEPIYGAVEVSNPNAFAAQNQTDISISYLGTTRNQWNNTNQQDYVVSNTDANKASDILFNDFELNYAYENRDVKSDNGITKLGVVIEKIGEVQYDSTGSPILDMSYYSAEDNSANVMSFARTAVDKATGKAGSNSVKNYTIDKNLVNNKNRVEFYYNTYNAYGNNDHGDGSWKYTSNVKNNVYRAYTYMVVDGTVVLSSKPAFFTMYGEAV